MTAPTPDPTAGRGLSEAEREALNVAVDEAETCVCCGDDYGSTHVYAAVERIVAARESAAATRARAEERERIARAHPVKVTRHCGNRLAEPVDPPPGPPSPPEWCNREADHEGECMTYDGRRLSGFVRAGVGIEERPAVVSYRCQTCQTQQDTKSPTPCDTLRIARALAPDAAGESA